MKLSDIDFSRLKFPKLKELIRNQMESGVVEFTDLNSTVPKKSDLDTYGFVADEFFVDHPIEVVFNHYKTANPNEAWDGGSLISLGLGIDKNTGEIFYPNESYPGFKVGQVLYLHSSIWGLKKLSMAQEIVTMDDPNFLIEFSYIENGLTAGIQIMQFSEINKNRTKISHVSRFKGVNRFRDKYLYPYFHSKLVSKFHANLKRSLG
jgi:hypothetical protein